MVRRKADIFYGRRMADDRSCSLLFPKGTLINAATWIRSFVQSHPMYKQDSVVSQEINFDLMIALDELWV